jgi:hypothetical protein
VFVRYVANLPEEFDTQEACASAADGVHFVTSLGHVNEDTRFYDLVVEPLSSVVLDDRRKKILVITRTYICNSIL